MTAANPHLIIFASQADNIEGFGIQGLASEAVLQVRFVYESLETYNRSVKTNARM